MKAQDSLGRLGLGHDTWSEEVSRPGSEVSWKSRLLARYPMVLCRQISCWYFTLDPLEKHLQRPLPCPYPLDPVLAGIYSGPRGGGSGCRRMWVRLTRAVWGGPRTLLGRCQGVRISILQHAPEPHCQVLASDHTHARLTSLT